MAGPESWIGRTVGEGRYEILAEIGEGSMGYVYRAHARHIGTDVAIKVPAEATEAGPAASSLERFRHEVESLVRLRHPHVVRVFDVGEEGGLPFVVMEYLSGGSLADRIGIGESADPEPMPTSSLRDWLPQIAQALDFIHGQDYLHRDVKPANILFDGHGNAFLGDFGIIKLLSLEGERAGGINSSALTSPGFLMGTPNYMAPELVMGLRGTKRVDQYSLAMIVHEALTGRNVLQGPTPSATLVNQTKVVPPALLDTVPNIPPSLSAAVARALSKSAPMRYEGCTIFANEALADVPEASSLDVSPSLVQRGESGQTPCPGCGAPLAVGPNDQGTKVRCPACGAESWVRVEGDEVRLGNVGPSPAPRRSRSPRKPPKTSWFGASWARGAKPAPEEEINGPRPRLRVPLSRRETLLAMLASNLSILFVLARLGYLGEMFRGGRPKEEKPPWANPNLIELNIADGTEKQKWFEETNQEFRKTDAGRFIHINLIPLGSLEGMQAIIDGPNPTPIHVWAPASSVTRDLFERNWLAKHRKGPIIRAETLALTPMVFVMWKDRHDAFIRKYKKLDFATLSQAMLEPGGWGAIADEPSWGAFRFGHTDPVKSNSGLIALVLMAYEHAHKQRGLAHADVSRPEFRSWLQVFEGLLSRPTVALTHSTGTLMKEMVSRGPSQYDGVLVYENLAIDSVIEARGTWGELHVAYPDPNIWNEHPYYILNAPWSDSDHHKAAAVFLDFLMSEPSQRKALERGLRPGNPVISINTPESPIRKGQDYGVRVAIPPICEPPRADVVTELIEFAKRIEP